MELNDFPPELVHQAMQNASPDEKFHLQTIFDELNKRERRQQIGRAHV